MADISCSAIVHWREGVVLVRDNPNAMWRLPTRDMQPDEGPILCIRRCVLTQTGYRAQSLRLFKIEAHGSDPKRRVRFIFGCQIEPMELQAPQCEVKTFTPDEVLGLAEKKLFGDDTLLRLIYNFKNMLPTPLSPNAMQPLMS